MPTELERQLARFAEALDQEAPAISVDGIVTRRAVALAVDPDEIGEPDLTVELALADAARRPDHRRAPSKVALGVAAAAVLVVALATVWVGGDAEPASAPATVPTTTDTPTSGGMWPQATLEEVRAAQERADAGDPDDTWQLAPQLVEDYWTFLVEGGQVELVDRFIREVLGWGAYAFNAAHEGDRNAQGAIDGAMDGQLTDQQFLRCAPGLNNPLYPPQPGGAPGESCAPTLDDLTYESVSLDLVQLDRNGSAGIWVVRRWALTTFTQADPATAEARATQRVDEFLAARIAGAGAEGLVKVYGDVDIPLLYTTTSGAPYDRYEIEPLDGPRWPTGSMSFSVRLLADTDAIVVEQTIHWSPSDELWVDHKTTTENAQPVTLSFASSDGEASVMAPSTWDMFWPGVGSQADVWFGNLWPAPYGFFDGVGIGFVDPVAYDQWCAENGGNPLLSEQADAAAIAQQLMADTDFETTAPVAARIGGLDAISMDVTLAPGGEACGIGRIEISRWVHELGWDRGLRLRLYLVDLPDGMSVRTLAITVSAPEEGFDAFIEATQPIIDSIEFHP